VIAAAAQQFGALRFTLEKGHSIPGPQYRTPAPLTSRVDSARSTSQLQPSRSDTMTISLGKSGKVQPSLNHRQMRSAQRLTVTPLGAVGRGLVAGAVGTAAMHALWFVRCRRGGTISAATYVILPAAKLYQPIWEYDRNTLGKDLTANLTFGFGTAAAMQLLLDAARTDASC
jgi:hypothetical protein